LSNINESIEEAVNNRVGPRNHGSSLLKNSPSGEHEMARINLRGTQYSSMVIINDLVCRVYHENQYHVCINAKDHPGFEACTYEACGSDLTGMLAMNKVLEQMRADCEWLDSMPEGALLEPGQDLLKFLLTYLGPVFNPDDSTDPETPARLQRALDRIHNARVAESLKATEADVSVRVITPGKIYETEHKMYINDRAVEGKTDEAKNDLNSHLEEPVIVEDNLHPVSKELN
jgi:hypothetical protein